MSSPIVFVLWGTPDRMVPRVPHACQESIKMLQEARNVYSAVWIHIQIWKERIPAQNVYHAQSTRNQRREVQHLRNACATPVTLGHMEVRV